jgi:hypothetical protein
MYASIFAVDHNPEQNIQKKKLPGQTSTERYNITTYHVGYGKQQPTADTHMFRPRTSTILLETLSTFLEARVVGQPIRLEGHDPETVEGLVNGPLPSDKKIYTSARPLRQEEVAQLSKTILAYLK